MESKTQTTVIWSPLQKIAFRFAFIVFGSFILIENNGAYPFWGPLMELYPVKVLHNFIPWVGQHLLHLSYQITVFTNGSGDTSYDYVIVFCIFVLAIFGSIIWSVLDRKRENYLTLLYWLTVAVRYYVGMMLISYGLVKVFKLQFPSPHFLRLTSTYGDSSPMGLAWTFLGFSEGYNLFMGLAEVAAVLLLFRRTVTFGAIISLMTTANVMAVNYFYDVPVKILSTALVIMTLFLLTNDAKRLLSFFFSGKSVSLPIMSAPEISKPWLRITKLIFKFLLIGFVLIYQAVDDAAAVKQYGAGAPKPKLYGLYEVDSFVVGHDTLPPLTTDSMRWRHLFIEWEDYGNVRLMNDSSRWIAMNIDTVRHTLYMRPKINPEKDYSFNYYKLGNDRFLLKGKSGNDSLAIQLVRKDPRNFRLIRRGFHWVNEYPYNR